jgi:hypothetical protein
MYELWDTKSGNLLEEFESEAEALKAVRGYLKANGPEMVRDLVLGTVPSSGLVGVTGLPPILDGGALLDRLRAAPERSEAGGQVPRRHAG